MTPIRIIGARNIVGECVLWNPRHQQLWWTDIQGSQLHRYDWAGEQLDVYSTPERVGSFGFVADEERLVTAFASGVALYDVNGASVEWIARPQEIVAGGPLHQGPRGPRRGVLGGAHGGRAPEK